MWLFLFYATLFGISCTAVLVIGWTLIDIMKSL